MANLININKKYYITYSRGHIETNLLEGLELNTKHISKVDFTPKDVQYTCLTRIYKICSDPTIKVSDKNNMIGNLYRILDMSEEHIPERIFEIPADEQIEHINNDSTISAEDAVKAKQILEVKETLTKLIDFFTEFNFSPSYRFVNCMAISKDPTTYVRNYFMVQDHPYSAEINEKIQSREFKAIAKSIAKCKPTPINTRFELYFGDPGAGKTTKAMSITKKHIVCSSDMLPNDLMQNFGFKDGKADFIPSDLWMAMENGESIMLDEVNMLPFESLRFLQGITDSKSSIDFKGHTINIHPNFRIYATMNLNVNGECIPLPSPLVDRAYDIVEFKLTADDLISAVMN